MTTDPKALECDKIVLHTPASIQPFGFILILDDDLRVVDFGGEIPFDIASGELLSQFSSDIATKLTHTRIDDKRSYFTLRIGSVSYDFALHKAEHIILDAILSTDAALPSLSEIYSLCERLFDDSKNMQELYDNMVSFISKLTGFDRVMLYKFDENFNGEVIAESKKDSVNSFLHHHFPATDIPAPARELYYKNPVRMVFSSSAKYSSLQNHLATDMSLSVLRSIAEIHKDYLQHMGVEASSSISIKAEGKLWGLIACHHETPKKPCMRLAQILEILSLIFSRELRIKQVNESAKTITDKIGKIYELCEKSKETVIDKGFLNGMYQVTKGLCDILACDAGVLLSTNGQFLSAKYNTNLDDEALGKIAKELETRNLPYTSHDSAEFDLLELSRGAFAGIFAIEVNIKQGYILMLFRKEESKSIIWAGEPAKDGTSGFLSPRESFEAWTQDVKGKSANFTNEQRALASGLGDKIVQSVGNALETIEINNQKIMLAINREQQRSHEYLQLVEVIILALDKNGNIILINRKACSMLGYNEEELIGKNWFETCLRKDEYKDVFEVFKNIISGKASLVKYYENCVVNKKGKERIVYWHNTELRDDNGAIIGVLTSGEDITDRESARKKLQLTNDKLTKANKKLKELSVIDPMTGLYNRRYFGVEMRNIYRTAMREKTPIGFLILDIDNFKLYNDTYGHDAGDRALVSVTRCIKSVLKRSCDIAFRLGGEEFGAIITAKSQSDIIALCEKIRTKVESAMISHIKNEPYGVITISGGLSVCFGCSGIEQESIYKAADTLLYKAKNSGKNKIIVGHNENCRKSILDTQECGAHLG